MKITTSLYDFLKRKNLFNELVELPGTRFRDLNNRLTKRIQINEQNYFLKYHHGVGWKEIFKNLLHGQLPVISAHNEKQVLELLKEQGLIVPTVFGYAAKGLNPARKKSFVLLEAMEPSISLEDLALQQEKIGFRQKKNLITSVANIAKIIHQNGVFHRDLYLCHFLLLPSSIEAPKLAIIDFHRARQFKKLPKRFRKKDLAGLYFSSMIANLTKHDRCRFLKTYFNCSLRDIDTKTWHFLAEVKQRANKLYRKHYGSTTKELSNDLGEVLPQNSLLEFKDNIPALKITETLRVSPGKRRVVKGVWQNKRVVAKIYVHPLKRFTHAQREENGIQKLIEANVLTPKLLFKAEAKHQSMTVLIYEEIFPILNIKEELIKPHAEKMLFRFIDTLVQHHHANILQKDLHIGNFLATEEHVYTLDGDQIVKADTALSEKESFENLALFLAQFTWLSKAENNALIRHYLIQRSREWSQEAQSAITKMVEEQITIRGRKFLKKIYRNCTQFSVAETYKNYRAVVRDHNTTSMQQALSDLDSVIKKPGTKLLKNGNTCTVAKVGIAGRSFVLKRYNIKNIRHFLTRIVWRPTRAWRSWYGAQLYHYFSIATLNPVALLERRWGKLRRNAYFLAEVLEGELLRDYFMNPDYTDKQKKLMANQAMSLLKRLKDLNIAHGDMKETNFIVNNGRLFIIDLDSVVWYKSSKAAEKAIAQDWKRFFKNWHQDPEILSLFII